MAPSEYWALYAHGEPAVMDVIVRCATCVILARASPRKPNVAIFCSEKRGVSTRAAPRSSLQS